MVAVMMLKSKENIQLQIEIPTSAGIAQTIIKTELRIHRMTGFMRTIKCAIQAPIVIEKKTIPAVNINVRFNTTQNSGSFKSTLKFENPTQICFPEIISSSPYF